MSQFYGLYGLKILLNEFLVDHIAFCDIRKGQACGCDLLGGHNGGIGSIWLRFKFLLYLHYISGEDGVLQVLFVIVGLDMLGHKSIVLPPYSPNRSFRRLSNKLFILRVWARTKNMTNSKTSKTGSLNQLIKAYYAPVRLIFLLFFD